MCDGDSHHENYIQDFANYFYASTAVTYNDTESYTPFLKSLADFFHDSVEDLSDPTLFLCGYSRAPCSAWRRLLTMMWEIIRYLRDNQFNELEILYEVPSENNAIKASAIYYNMVKMLTDIEAFEFFLSKKSSSFDLSTYNMVERHIHLIKRCVVMISSKHRSICLEKYE